MADERDPVADLLNKAPLSNAQRADLWDAYHNAADADALASALQSVKVRDEIKASLWDLKANDAPQPPPMDAEGAAQPESAPPSRTWADTAKDVGLGVVKGAANTALDLGGLVSAIPGVGAVTNKIGNAIGGAVGQMAYGTKAEPVATDAAFGAARERTAYSNAPQQVGGALETVAELAVPVTKGTKAAAAMLPSTEKAGVKFQQVMARAATVPVDTQASGQVALRINELAERGGSMPMAVRKYLNRVTDPNKATLTYEEARDFASNISRLSANEFGRLTPVVAREVANLRVTLNKEIAGAAVRAGKGKEYAQAMTEYAKAMRLRGFFESAVQGAKRNLPWASVAGGTYYGMQKLKQLLGE